MYRSFPAKPNRQQTRPANEALRERFRKKPPPEHNCGPHRQWRCVVSAADSKVLYIARIGVWRLERIAGGVPTDGDWRSPQRTYENTPSDCRGAPASQGQGDEIGK